MTVEYKTTAEFHKNVWGNAVAILEAGSRTQGTSREDSDTDTKSIHFNPEWMDYPELTQDKASLAGNDHVSYGLDRFRELLSKGNWDAVEMIHVLLAGGVYRNPITDPTDIIKFDDIVKLDNPTDRSAILNKVEYYDNNRKRGQVAHLPYFVNEMKRTPSIYLWWIFVHPEKFISKDTFNNTKGFISYNSKTKQWVGEVVKSDMDLKTGEVKNPKHVQHAFRVYNTCIQCIEESEKAGSIIPLRINREGIDANWLKEIKYNNKYSANELLEMLIEKKNKLEELSAKTTVIPKHIPAEVITKLNESCKLIKRNAYFNKYSYNTSFVNDLGYDDELEPEHIWGEKELFNFNESVDVKY
jgi:hypothetical protein